MTPCIQILRSFLSRGDALTVMQMVERGRLREKQVREVLTNNPDVFVQAGCAHYYRAAKWSLRDEAQNSEAG